MFPISRPYSFFNAFNYQPPVVGFSSVGWKDSVANVEGTGEFVWNLATRPMASAMNETSASIPSDDDEFVRCGLTPVPSIEVIAAAGPREPGQLRMPTDTTHSAARRRR